MAIPAIIISTICYLTTCISCFRQGDNPHCVMWAGYVFANLGLLWYEYSKVGS
jgi:hypothetical protein